MIIYKTTNLINGKIYIGLDSKNNPKYFGSGILIKKAIKKYGKFNFKKEILEECKIKEELCKREKYWIKKENSIVPNGYNITPGGEFGDIFTNNPNKEKIRKKFSESHKNPSKEIRKHYSDSHLGQIPWNKGLTKENDERLKKISIVVSKSVKKLWKNAVYKKNALKGLKKFNKKLKGHSYSEIYGEEKSELIKQKLRVGLYKKCENCNNIYYVEKYRIKKSRFCSSLCKQIYRKGKTLKKYRNKNKKEG